jgi:ribosomal-protein-alanine N-acetyltransferase
LITPGQQPTFPVLYTEKCILRQITVADKRALFEGLSDPAAIQYYGVSYRSIEEIQWQLDWFESLLKTRTGIWWAICFKETPDQLIGTCGFNNWKKEHKCTDMGYWLLPAAWNQGIMVQCVQAIIDYAFTHMDIHRIEAIVEKENVRSSHLLRKLQFTLEGVHRECEIKNKKYIDLEFYARLNPVN